MDVSKLALTLVTSSTLLFAVGCGVGAMRPHPATTPATREVTGHVTAYTTAPRGELDGVVLEDGTRVQFPPHAGASVRPLIGLGEKVCIIGSDERGPGGRAQLRALAITNVNPDHELGDTIDARRVDIQSLPPPDAPTRPGPSPSAVAPPGSTLEPTTTRSSTTRTVVGRVLGYTTVPRGDMDGVLLDNGAWVHFPTEAGRAVAPLVGHGNTIRVVGWEMTGPDGVVLEASKITTVRDGRTVDIVSVQKRHPR